MHLFPQNISPLYPLVLEACMPDDNNVPPAIVLDAPDNFYACQLLTPLAGQFHHLGVTRHAAGYDCGVELLALPALTGHLIGQAYEEPACNELAERLRKPLRRWQNAGAEYVRLTLPLRLENFGIEQQVWGHENAGHAPELRRRARALTRDNCSYCGYHSKQNPLIFRDCNPENQADDNLGVACPICACSRHLNRLGANDGVMVYLPELAPADISHLLRTVVVARRQGDERQKQGASAVLAWLTEHRREAEAFWGTSHPGEFGQALMQAPDRLRDDLQQRLRHIALIPNPDLIGRRITTLSMPATGWLSLTEQYRRHA